MQSQRPAQPKLKRHELAHKNDRIPYRGMRSCFRQGFLSRQNARIGRTVHSPSYHSVMHSTRFLPQ